MAVAKTGEGEISFMLISNTVPLEILLPIGQGAIIIAIEIGIIITIEITFLDKKKIGKPSQWVGGWQGGLAGQGGERCARCAGGQIGPDLNSARAEEGRGAGPGCFRSCSEADASLAGAAVRA